MGHLDELRGLLALLRENGVYFYKHGDLELRISDIPPAAADAPEKSPEEDARERAMAEHRLLYASAGHEVEFNPAEYGLKGGA